jgi:hypothetical protein
MDSLAAKLQLNTSEDWYGVSLKTVEKLGGASLLNHYGGSLTKGLCKC